MKLLVRHYLFYLGILPSLATFAVLWTYGHPNPFLVFLGGIVAVSVYLAATYSYTQLPNQLLPALIMLLDGPLFVLVSIRNDLNPLAFAIEGYLVDGTILWLSILVLAARSPLPSRGQRVGSILFMLVAIGATTSLFWPYIKAELWGQTRAIWLILGLVQGAISQYGVVRKDEVVRSGDGSIRYIVGLLGMWLVSMIIGMSLYDGNVPVIF